MSPISLLPTVEDYTSSDDETQDVSVVQKDDKAALDSPSPAEYDPNKLEHIGLDASPSGRDAVVYPNAPRPRPESKSPPSNKNFGLLFITSNTPAELKSKKNMTKVRKKAMGSYLQEKKPKIADQGRTAQIQGEGFTDSRTISVGSNEHETDVMIPNTDTIMILTDVRDADDASNDHDESEDPITFGRTPTDSTTVPSTSNLTLAPSASDDEEEVCGELLDDDIADLEANGEDESQQVSQSDTVDHQLQHPIDQSPSPISSMSTLPKNIKVTSNPTEQKPRKLRASCDACSRAKVRCDKVRPTCHRCGKMEIRCNYSPSMRLGKLRKNRNPDGSIMRDVAGVILVNKLKEESDAVVERSTYVASSSQKQLVASVSRDKTIRLWEVATGLCCSTLEGHSDSNGAVAFSPDGQLVASATQDKTVRLWDVASSLFLSTLEGHSKMVLAVAFSPNSRMVASASLDNTVRLWKVATGLCLHMLRGHDNRVTAIAFSPDGQLVASASWDKTIRLWKVATGLCLRILKGHTDSVTAVAFSPDGQLIASPSWDKTIRLWKVATGLCFRVLESHNLGVNAIAFSPNGQLVISASWDKTMRLWEVATGLCFRTLMGHTNGVNAVAFSPDGQLVASASMDKTVRLWDVATGSNYRTLEGHTECVSAVAFSIPQIERGAKKEELGRLTSTESTSLEDRLDKPLSPFPDTTYAEEQNNSDLERKVVGLPETEMSYKRLNERPDVFGHELTISIDDSTYPETDASYGRSTLSERRERRLSRESMHSRDRQPSTSGRWRSVRPRSPPSRPQSYYGPPLSFPTKTSRNSRPSSIMSAGSNDSGFGEGVFDLISQRRSSTTFQPPTNYHYTAPPAYIHNPYYPTYLPAVNYSSVMYDDPTHLSPIPQSSRLSLPSTLPTYNPLTPLSSISPSFQNWPRSALDAVDVTKHPDYEKCSKLFADADHYRKGELTAAEVRIVFVHLMPLHQNVIENLVRLFAIRTAAKENDPLLNFAEFFSLWRYCKEWSAIFRTADADKNGRISHLEFRTAFRNWDGFGYQLTPNILKESLRTFDRRGNEALGLDIESFLNICIGLKRITDEFDRWDQERTWRNSLSFEKYALGLLQFHREMSINQHYDQHPVGDEKTEAMETTVLSSVPQHMMTPNPLPTVLEVNASAESIPQLKDVEILQDFGDRSKWNEEITLNNWTHFLPHLPEAYRDQLELREVFGSGLVWTCTPGDCPDVENIPLTIAGRPVVVPVEYYYPLMSATTPPPDPHPRFIDPSKSIDETIVNEIFNTFERALGFYLLINGMLQIIVSEDFDFQYALSHRPNEFGGLKVSYITQNMIPTAETSAESSNTTVTVHPPSPTQTQPHGSMVGSSRTNLTQRTNQSGGPTRLELGSLVQAKVEKSKATERFQGKVGIMTTSDDSHFLVVSTHVLTQALTAAKHDSFPGPDWTKNVTVLSGNGGKEIGKISSTFDPQARAFPHGFLHDVSLVDVTYAPMHLVSGIKSPIPAQWLSQAGWSNIKYTTQTLFLLDSPNIQSKSIGILGSQCQMVGQGIFRLHSQLEKKTRFKFSFGHKRSNSASTTSTPETWTALVSRSVLYRVDPEFRSPGAHSGTAICVHEESEDEVGMAKIAGFSSYCQQVSDVQRFDMEGKKFYNRLEEGRVAFYGALQAPETLRDEHDII